MLLSYIKCQSLNEKWAEVLKNANVFFQDAYREYIKDSNKECILIYSPSYIVPFVISKKAFFKYGFFPSEPYCYSNSIKEDLVEFLDATCEYLRDIFNIQWIDQNSTASLFSVYPKASKHIPFGSHIIDLNLSEDELWKKVHSKHRNVIKKAEKDGVLIEKGSSERLIRDYYSLDVETWNRSNRSAAGLASLKKMVKAMGDNAIVYMAYLDDEPQSGAVLFYNDSMCYYMLGANKTSPHTGAGNYLQWKAILDMKNQGIKHYSFVGCRINEDENSKYHGIQRFKERFGGDLVQCFLFKMVFRNDMKFLFNIVVSFKEFLSSGRISKHVDIIDQEEHKWK